MIGKVVAAIVVVIGLITTVFFFGNGSNMQVLQNSLKSTVSEASSKLSTNREPIKVYENCYSSMHGYPSDARYRDIETTCQDKSFKFTMPSQLGTISSIRTESTVYQYGDNDFEIGFLDEVGEKRYAVKLWELPQ